MTIIWAYLAVPQANAGSARDNSKKRVKEQARREWGEPSDQAARAAVSGDVAGDSFKGSAVRCQRQRRGAGGGGGRGGSGQGSCH